MQQEESKTSFKDWMTKALEEHESRISAVKESEAQL